jgi:gluconate 5-dehydrogenase
VGTPDSEERFGLRHRVVLVTGSGRGIGWEIARGLASHGAVVVLNGRDQATLDERVSTLRESGGEAEGVAFDVADHDALVAALDGIVSRNGALDAVFANVGQRLRRPTIEVSRSDFAGLIDVNLIAAYDLCRESAMRMAAAGGGTVVLVSSIAASRGAPGNAAYSASKGALESLVRCFAVEFGPQGVRTNAIAPGAFATETNLGLQGRTSAERRVPLRRWGRPDECTGAAVFLASDASSYVNGHVLVVDGGLSVAL